MATCRDCALWEIEAAKDKAGRVLSARAVKCSWVSKEKYPLSVNERFHCRPTPGYMTAKDGHRCPCFQRRK